MIVRLRQDGLIWQRVAEEIVALDLASSNYLRVNPSAAVLWDELLAGASVDQLVARLRSGFDVDPVRARADVESLVSSLRASGLLDGG